MNSTVIDLFFEGKKRKKKPLKIKCNFVLVFIYYNLEKVFKKNKVLRTNYVRKNFMNSMNKMTDLFFHG